MEMQNTNYEVPNMNGKNSYHSHLCRLCLLEDGTMPIFSDGNVVRVSLKQKIANCLSLEVFEGDGLPTLICESCSSLVDKFYDFKQLCKYSESTLKDHLETQMLEGRQVQYLDGINRDVLSQRHNANESRNKVHHTTDMIRMSSGSELDTSIDCCRKIPGHLEANQEVDSVPNSLTMVSESALKEHVEPGSFICKTCFKSFAKQIYLTKHEINHAKRAMNTCNNCGINFIRPGDLSQHKRSHCILGDLAKEHSAEELSNKQQTFVCSICSKTFTKQVYLKRHEVVHTGKRPYICNDCGSSFSRTGDLAKHVRIHSKSKTLRETLPDLLKVANWDIGDEGSKIFVCKMCSRTFTKEYYLKQHEVVHSETSTYLCDRCGKSFCRRGALTQHKAIHSSIKSHFCNICNKAFAFVGRLKEHERLHAGIKPYLCNMCGKAFATKEGLLGHERTHTGEKPYTCDVCDRSFATSSNFRTHMRHHSEGKRFLCNICRVSFFTKSGLERHERLHTGVKPFACDICTVAFYTKREVIRHKLFHLGNKRFSCDICSKSYYERQHLIIHQRTHTGERPYSCNWCKKSFFERSKLKRHIHTHTL